MSSKIKFGKILEELLKEREASKDRKKFCLAVEEFILVDDYTVKEEIKKHISPSGLSQYIQGHTKPSFYVLVAMAETLEVSLDYLVFGRESNRETVYDESPALRYIDKSITTMERRSEQNRQLYVAISRILADRLEKYVERTASKIRKDTSLIDSLIGVQDMERTRTIETFSEETAIATRSLQLNVIRTDNVGAEGPFFSTVANNLLQERPYRFLLPKLPDHDWKPEVASYRNLLKARGLSSQQINKLRFKEISNFPLTGITFCRLNFDELRTQQPIIYEDLSRAVYHDERNQRWIGYVQPPMVGSRADLLMDTDHVRNGLPYFENLWKSVRDEIGE